ncbi:MAG TPA: hypothetical protein VN366_07605 [Feifaniaceae bacterium]|nr:hypothetical protein [Feifaniaceae bacterium]
MFRLPTIKFWRNTGLIVLLLCICFTLLGTFGISGPIAYRWGAAVEPNAFGGRWVLWAMLVLSVLSLFAAASFTKPKPGQRAVSKETASALAIGLMSIFTGVDIILVLYAFYPLPAVPIAGTIGVFLAFVLYLLIAAWREKHGPR